MLSIGWWGEIKAVVHGSVHGLHVALHHRCIQNSRILNKALRFGKEMNGITQSQTITFTQLVH